MPERKDDSPPLPAAADGGRSTGERAGPGAGRSTGRFPGHGAGRILAAGIFAAIVLRSPLASQDAEGTARESGKAKPAAEDPASFWNDPTLGGKLHFTYRAAYQAKFYQYHGYRYPFPDEVTTLDEAAAKELEQAHHDRTQDHDLDQYFSLRTHDLFLPTDEKKYLQSFDTEFSLRYFHDLDGSPVGDEAQDTHDLAGGSENLQLRTLFARAQVLDRHLTVTGGRMFLEEAEWIHLDGGDVVARGIGLFGKPLEIEAFGGERVTYYSTVPRSSVVGGALRYWPWESGRLELASLYFLSNTFQATFDQHLGPSTLATAVYRQIDEDPESIRLDVNSDWAEAGLTFWGEYLGKFGLHAKDYYFDYTARVPGTARERAALRYFNLGDIDPFDEGSLEVRWSAARKLGLLAGGTGHLRREGDADQFNTDWYEAWAGFDTNHFPWEGLTSRTVVRYVHTDHPRRRTGMMDPFFSLQEDAKADGEPSFLGVETFVEQDFARRVTLGANLEFRQYDYQSRFATLNDIYALGVSTYVRYRQNRFLSYSVIYAYDRDYHFVNPDFESVHGVRAEVMFSF